MSNPDGTRLGTHRTPGRRIATIVASVVAVIALVAGIAWFATSTAAANREKAVRETAVAYLTAVAEADADRALSLLDQPPGNRTLLTHDVLEASRAAAPLTAIEVTGHQAEERTARVDVTYRLGDLPVTTALTLTGDGRTAWKVADGTSELLINDIRALTVNGARLNEPGNPVFPGTYTATSVSDLVTLTGEPTAVIPDPSHPVGNLTVAHAFNEKGNQAVLAAVKGNYDACLAATESLPPGCPFGVLTDNVEVAPGSVRFAAANDPWAGFAPTFDPDAMTAKGTLHSQVNATATVTANGVTIEGATIALAADRTYTVDLTREPLTVAWA